MTHVNHREEGEFGEGATMVLDDHRVEWQRRHLQWLLPRIMGSTEDKLQFLDIWNVAMTERHVEGTLDAKAVVERVHAEFPCSQTKVLVKALGDLAKLNRKDANDG